MRSPIQPLARRYLEAQLEGDRARSLRVVLDEALGRGMPIPDVYLHVIQAAQRELGCMWAEHEISVAREHMATVISQIAMAHLYRYFPREPKNEKTILIGCVEGELHDMGPRMCTDFLEAAGFSVRSFGANLPTDALLELVSMEHPVLVGLSVSTPENLPVLERAVDRVRGTFGEAVQIAVGGAAVLATPSIEARLGVRHFGEDARQLAGAARRAFLPSDTP